MVNIVSVYEALKDIANKDQQGFVTPKEFNRLASVVQNSIYNEIMNDIIDAKKISRQSFDVDSEVSISSRKREDIMYFLNDVSILNTNGVISLPDDVSKIASVFFDNEEPIECEIVRSASVINSLKRSKLSAPTDDYPIAYRSGSELRILPESSSGTVVVSYYRTPGSISNGGWVNLPPSISVIAINGDEMTVEQNSRHFSLPPHYLSKTVFKMAEMIGLNLRDGQIAQFAQLKSAEE